MPTISPSTKKLNQSLKCLHLDKYKILAKMKSGSIQNAPREYFSLAKILFILITKLTVLGVYIDNNKWRKIKILQNTQSQYKQATDTIL